MMLTDLLNYDVYEAKCQYVAKHDTEGFLFDYPIYIKASSYIEAINKLQEKMSSDERFEKAVIQEIRKIRADVIT